ncbi:Astra associated protein 1 Asa1 [Malassezia cuniculi]|uniref:ASTRA-associated protein 1 n=1 Tax=Malassezia cuniculi TaxID=948313 RepID=A0AAF0JAL0_9BASI|nr:Astra associated protein 1 Asa1 [Malassezia cuniculi]
MRAAALAPRWVLRHHAPTPVHSVAFANGNSYVIAGDAKGRVSVTSTADYRPRLFWNAHTDTVLRAGAWDGYIVTHGRDNKICVWSISQDVLDAPFVAGGLESKQVADAPTPVLELPVNALNYCPFDMVSLGEGRALLAVTNTLESAFVDVYELPSKKRVIAAIGSDNIATAGTVRPAITMSLRIFRRESETHLLAAFEDGNVSMWTLQGDSASLEWSAKHHVESAMSVALSPDASLAVSVGADDKVALYGAESLVRATGHFGNACATVRGDAKVLAVGSWDSRVRIYSLPALKQLATLSYHKESVYAVAFAKDGPLVGAPEEGRPHIAMGSIIYN